MTTPQNGETTTTATDGGTSTITESTTTTTLPAPATEPTPDPDKTFTQAELNRYAGQARIEERAKVADYEELKTKAGELDAIKLAQLSTEERLTAEVTEAKQATATAGEELTEMAITTAIQVKAAQMGLHHPEDALFLVSRAEVSYSKESGVKGVTEALDALVQARPDLKGAGTKAPNLNANGGTPTEVVAGLSDGERQMAHKLFRTKDGKQLTPAESEAEYAAGKRT